MGRWTTTLPRRCISPFREDKEEKSPRDDLVMMMSNMYWLLRSFLFDLSGIRIVINRECRPVLITLFDHGHNLQNVKSLGLISSSFIVHLS